MNKRDWIEQNSLNEHTLFADGFDDAILGLDYSAERVVYSISKCIKILEEEMDREEAVEYFYFNTAGAYVGEMTPIWVDDLDMDICE